MKHLVLFLLRGQPVLEALVIDQLFVDLILCVSGPHQLVRDLNLVDTALVKQLEVLAVANLALLALLEFLPRLVLNHCSVSIQVLSLKFDFFQLLS